jgi:DUF1365 family protein
LYLATGEIRHTRWRPIVNSFCYPALFLRIPIHDLATIQWPALMRHNQWGLWSFYNHDHGDGRTPLHEWALATLRSTLADLPPAEQSTALWNRLNCDNTQVWLHSFPRILGYTFNPVSFWFIHEKTSQALLAIICEVHNTFGQKHCYVLRHPNGQAIRNGELFTADKVFHVSPFCPVTGHYRFRFAFRYNPQCPSTLMQLIARIDYDDAPLLSSLIHSATAPDPLINTAISGKLEVCTSRRLLSLLLKLGWFTVGVMLKIHWQAFQLWRRNVRFFRLPIQRQPTTTHNHSDI